jgi:two-component system sensor histidine kinase PilS (NtrC family)
LSQPKGKVVPVIDEQTERRLIWLMGGRLVLALSSLALAAGLDGLGRELSDEARSGIYWTVTFAFFVAVLSGASFNRIRNPQRFANLQIGMDAIIVSFLVYFSGGRDSVFTFLYVLVILYGALLFKRRVALRAAILSVAGYGLALYSANEGWYPGGDPVANSIGLPYLAAVWCVHGGALFLVGALASVLSGEIQRVDAALEISAQDLQQLRYLHQCTVESIMSGLLTTNSEGSIMSFNPEAERITGHSVSEATGRKLGEVIPGAPEFLADREYGASTETQRTRLGYENARGERLHLGLAGSVLRDAEGENVGDVVIFQDVTEVVNMESELRRRERLAAVGELSAKIAHEIRNPLASISGSIEILRGDLATSDLGGEPDQLMGIVLRETQRLNSLITDFLLYARPAPMRLETVDLGSPIEDVLKLLQPACARCITLQVDVGAGLQVQADPGQLRQLLWNLCLNGIQSIQGEGSLTVSADRVPGEFPQGGADSHRNASWVEILISDSGCGIPSDEQERIFEPFYTTKNGGTGLGLAMVHRVVENHGGELQLVSELDRGTTFRIRLPGAESLA